jgi:TRAP-type uncharacterized transport system fused permease subunit
MLTWKYTLPAFLVPFVFTLTTDGMGVLMEGSVSSIATAAVTAALGITSLAGGICGWLRGRLSSLRRVGLVAGGVLLCFGRGWADLAGFVISSMVLFLQSPRQPRGAEPD